MVHLQGKEVHNLHELLILASVGSPRYLFSTSEKGIVPMPDPQEHEEAAEAHQEAAEAGRAAEVATEEAKEADDRAAKADDKVEE